MMKVLENLFLKLMFNILKLFITFTMIYFFRLKKQKMEIMEKFVASLLDKTEYAIHMRNFEKTLNLE